jgi:hypothetical protein
MLLFLQDYSPLHNSAGNRNAAALIAITLYTLRLSRSAALRLHDGGDGRRGRGAGAVAVDEAETGRGGTHFAVCWGELVVWLMMEEGETRTYELKLLEFLWFDLAWA